MSFDYTVVNRNFARGKEGSISVVTINNHKCILKQFKTTKSVDRLNREATLQQEAFELGVAPEVYQVEYRAKQIFMQGIDNLLMDLAKTRSPPQLFSHEMQRIENIMNILDTNGIFHNDGNCRNVMIDNDGVIYLIDYGMSKKITRKLRQKTQTPNIRYGLEAMKRSFNQNNIKAWP
jgi:tRNA A-37 threonylcarbamoyl transferase component Bud32